MYAPTLIRWSGLAAVVAGVLFLIVELLELLAIDLENLDAQATVGIFFCGPGYSCSPRCCYCWDWLGSTPTSRRLRASWSWQASLRHSWCTALAFAPPGVQPAAVGAVRIALGGLALLVLAALRGELRSGVGWPPLATTTAAVGIAAYQPFFFAGVARTGVALGTIVAIGSTPVWAGAIGFLFRGEKPTVRWGIATALAVSGCALLLLDAMGGVSVAAAGILFALAAGACYGAYATASKRLLTEVWTAGSS